MKSTRENWPVNWVDGMKINKSHFRAQEAYYDEQLALLLETRLTDQNFGLLPPSPDYPGPDLTVTDQIVEVNRCQLLTRGGYLLLVGNENREDLRRKVSDLKYGQGNAEADRWLLILRVHPGEQTTLGTPDPSERPLRHPSVTARLSIELLPEQSLGRASSYVHAAPIARLVRGYQGIALDPTYIAPVVRTSASAVLNDRLRHWQTELLALEGNTYEVIRKIKDKHRNETGNQLSADLLSLTLACIRYISSHFDAYRMTLVEREPVYLFTWFAGLARVVRDEFRLSEEPENLMGYLAYFIEGVSAPEMMNRCNALCDYRYDHLAIERGVEAVDRFLAFTTVMFDRMKELDYHQIAAPTIIDGSYFNQRENLSRPKLQPQSKPAMGPMRIKVRGSNKRPPSDPPAGEAGWGLE